MNEHEHDTVMGIYSGGGSMSYQDFIVALRIMDRLREAPFLPTPLHVIREMLNLARPKPGEVLVDLGSGDGRVLILAAKEYRCRCVGYEVDPRLVKISEEMIRREGLTDLVGVVRGDLFRANISCADVITIYLSPDAMRRLEPKLRNETKGGTRMVSHDYPIPGWQPIRVKRIDTGGIHVHRIYLYIKEG